MGGNLQKKILEASKGNRGTISAETYLKSWPTASKPALLVCNDDFEYVFKGSQNGKMIVADHIVGRLGELMGAPVGKVEFGEIPKNLRSEQKELGHFGPGICHATRLIKKCSERESINLQYAKHPQNVNHFSLLAVLYTWVLANDHQCIYENDPPHLVYSVDHGHFFPGGPKWTTDGLQSNHTITGIDPWFSACNLPEKSLSVAASKMVSVEDEVIENLVDSPPAEWGIDDDERATLKDYLIKRKSNLAKLLII